MQKVDTGKVFGAQWQLSSPEKKWPHKKCRPAECTKGKYIWTTHMFLSCLIIYFTIRWCLQSEIISQKFDCQSLQGSYIQYGIFTIYLPVSFLLNISKVFCTLSPPTKIHKTHTHTHTKTGKTSWIHYIILLFILGPDWYIGLPILSTYRKYILLVCIFLDMCHKKQAQHLCSLSFYLCPLITGHIWPIFHLFIVKKKTVILYFSFVSIMCVCIYLYIYNYIYLNWSA